MTTPSGEPPKVFISYSHDTPEHVDRVLALANRLRDGGVGCDLDQYAPWPAEGWPRWTGRQIEGADYVLVVGTEVYQRRFKGEEAPGKGLGAQWEGAIITQELYEAAGDNSKFIPVLFSPEDSKNIPHVLRGVQSYDLSSEGGYEDLYRRLTNQPRVTKPELGKLVALPTRERKQFFFNTWSIPYTPTPFFTGREDVLGRIREMLRTKDTVAVSGMPGVGKTQTAVEYAHRHRSEYRLILWARAGTHETFISDFVGIAGTLQLPEVRAQEQSLAVGAVRRWFDANPDWLLILDNADDLDLAREFMPSAPKGRIILTTREQATGAIASVEVLKMDEEDGARFLLRRAKRLAEDATLENASAEDREKAADITKEVDGLPLALDQAGAFIEEASSSPAEYFNLYRTRGRDLRGRRGKHVLDHPESVEITFTLSFDKVAAASPTAADLLRACAFLAPDLIPEEIFTEGGAHLGENLSATVNDRLGLIDAVTETLRYSLLRRDADRRTLSVHRIVQDVLKDTMDEGTQRQWAERVTKAANHVLPDFDETAYSDWPRFERLLPHAQVCAGLIERLDLKFPEAAHLLNNAARYIHDRGRLTEAESYYAQSLALRQHLFGQQHLDVATSLNNLGWVKHNLGKYAEAESLQLDALGIRTNLLGDDDVAVANSLSRLGWLKNEQGRYAEAKAYFNQSIEILKKRDDRDSALMAKNLHGLAGVLYRQWKYREAEALYLQALDIRRKIFGEQHASVAILLGELGNLYKSEGKHGEAEDFLINEWQMLERIYGVNHPLLANCLSSLADIYSDQNKLPEAEALSNRALAIAENAYGASHPRVGIYLSTVGNLYKIRGDFDKAEQTARRALDIVEKSFGEEHPDTSLALGNLGVIYMAQSRNSQAEQLLRRAVAVGKKTLPPTDPDLLDSQEAYAEVLRRMNRKGEAQKLRAHVEKMRSKQGRKKPKK